MDENRDESAGSSNQVPKDLQPDQSEIGEEKAKTEEGSAVDEETDYVPDDGENSFDDEATLDEEEALGDGADIADEIAALQDEQDIPVEELMRLYGYNNNRHGPSPSSSSLPTIGGGADVEKSGHSREHQNADNSYSSTSSDSNNVARHPPYFVPFDVGGEVGAVADNADEDDDREEGAGRERGYFSTSDEDSENDFDYVPEESWKKDIKVGPEHQADVPLSMISQLDEIDSADEMDECVWYPDLSRLDECALEKYLRSAYQSQREQQKQQSEAKNGSADDNNVLKIGGFGTKRKFVESDESSQQQAAYLRDDEAALKLLLNSQYDAETALALWKRLVSERKQKEPSGDDERPWTEEEQTAFEEGLKAHGKNFRLIQQEFLPNRTTSDMVRYYYLWKRTERHDVFVQTFRLEKRQCGLHPNATDYMDHFLDHMALVGATSSMTPPAATFQQGEQQQQHLYHAHQAYHHPYLSLLPSNNNSRHHFYSSQSQKANSDGAVVTEELNNVNNVDEIAEAEINHSPRDCAL